MTINIVVGGHSHVRNAKKVSFQRVFLMGFSLIDYNTKLTYILDLGKDFKLFLKC